MSVSYSGTVWKKSNIIPGCWNSILMCTLSVVWKHWRLPFLISRTIFFSDNSFLKTDYIICTANCYRINVKSIRETCAAGGVSLAFFQMYIKEALALKKINIFWVIGFENEHIFLTHSIKERTSQKLIKLYVYNKNHQ